MEDVAERMGVCTKTVRRWIAAGKLPILRTGRVVRVLPVDFHEFCRSRRTERHART